MLKIGVVVGGIGFVGAWLSSMVSHGIPGEELFFDKNF